MKTLTFSTKTWHYWFANICEPGYSFKYGTDICTYTRHVILGMLIVFFCTTLAILYTASVGDFLAWIATYLTAGIWAAPHVGAEINCMIIIVAILVGIAILANRALDTLDTASSTSFIRESYKAVKNRYCVYIDFEEIKNEQA